MTMYSGKLLDGYALSQTDGYHITTPWLDLHSVHLFSMIAMITGGTVAGTFTLQQANDDVKFGINNGANVSAICPVTATNAVSSALDGCNVPSGTGQTTIVLAASATPVALNQYLIGYRWARLVGVLTTQNLTGTCDIWYHWKH